MKPNLPAIKTILQTGDLDAAAQDLLTFAQAGQPRFASEIIGHLARLKQIAGDERKGVVSAETTRMGKNQVLYALLDLLEVMEEEDKRKPFRSLAEARGAGNIIIRGHAEQVIIVQGDHNTVTRQERVIEIGAGASLSAPVAVAGQIENSFNTLRQSQVSNDLKALLGELLQAVNEVNKSARAGQIEVAQGMVRYAEALVEEAASANPQRRRDEVSIEGLKRAAIIIGEVAAPVMRILQKLAPLLLH